MKETPDWTRILRRMQPGEMTRDGMLGEDRRPPQEIIAADAATMERLGVTREELARRLTAMASVARAAMGAVVQVDDRFEVRSEEAMGRIPCPFGHFGRYVKNITFLKNMETGEECTWTDLGVHMLEAHGFCEGAGAPFRLDPERAVRVLGVPSSPPAPPDLL